MSSEPTCAEARRLRHAERLLACFQKALGHELPNQLVAAQGLARLLEEEGNRLSPEGRECLGRLAAAVGRAHALVSELAELGRAGRLAGAGGSAVLGDVAPEALAEVNQLCPVAGIEYHIANPRQALPLPEASLRLVLVHLLRYAARGRPAHVEVGARPAAAGFELWVADDGPALAAAAGEGLFEPFPPGAEGRLGLFLCSLLAEGWGGALEARPGPGRGNRLLLTIPGPP